ncbi:Uncharacterized protein Fot_40048 [Forsythia ovata]|uniref:Uncharacterized protein n=1 Tax=Forsythia ovata TaxID=205694 RepID=A0ABD1S738_9LAMI
MAEGDRIMEVREEEMSSPLSGFSHLKIAYFIRPPLTKVPFQNGGSVLGNVVDEELEMITEKLLKARLDICRITARKASPSDWMLKFMDCETRGTEIALAPAVLADIYKNLRALKGALVASKKCGTRQGQKEVVKYKITVPFQQVQAWVWERYLTLCPKPNSTGFGEPRLAQWHGIKKLEKKNMLRAISCAKGSALVKQLRSNKKLKSVQAIGANSTMYLPARAGLASSTPSSEGYMPPYKENNGSPWCYYESCIFDAHHGLISTNALETMVLNGPVHISSLSAIVVETPVDGGSDLLLINDFLRWCPDNFLVPSRCVDRIRVGSKRSILTYIVDPLKEPKNLARSVSKGNFYQICSVFSYGARKLGGIFVQGEDHILSELHNFFSNTTETREAQKWRVLMFRILTHHQLAMVSFLHYLFQIKSCKDDKSISEIQPTKSSGLRHYLLRDEMPMILLHLIELFNAALNQLNTTFNGMEAPAGTGSFLKPVSHPLVRANQSLMLAEVKLVKCIVQNIVVDLSIKLEALVPCAFSRRLISSSARTICLDTALYQSMFLQDVLTEICVGSKRSILTYIVDPLKETNNLAPSVSKGNFYRICSAFSFGARKLGGILVQGEDHIFSELNNFFSNTIERHRSGESPDVQDPDPSPTCNGLIPALLFQIESCKHDKSIS